MTESVALSRNFVLSVILNKKLQSRLLLKPITHLLIQRLSNKTPHNQFQDEINPKKRTLLTFKYPLTNASPNTSPSTPSPLNASRASSQPNGNLCVIPNRSLSSSPISAAVFPSSPWALQSLTPSGLLVFTPSTPAAISPASARYGLEVPSTHFTSKFREAGEVALHSLIGASRLSVPQQTYVPPDQAPSTMRL
jgi:hypothetical protein